MKQVKVAFIGMTSCKGCFFEFLLLNRRLAEVFKNVRITNFWMLKEFNDRKGKYDIAFMDGAVSTDRELEELKSVRERTKYLIAYGTCACWGGIPALRNSSAGYRSIVYPQEPKFTSRDTVDAIDRHVKVDYYMRGCPVNEDEAFEVIADLMAGKRPREKDYCVCVECKKRGIRCLFKDGIACMGPVAYAGCNAPCPASRTPCDGCRGPLPDANAGAEIQLLKDHGISEGDIKIMFSKYSNTAENPKGTDKEAKGEA